MKNKIFGAVLAAVVLATSMAAPSVASAQSADLAVTLRAQIAALMQQIQALQRQLADAENPGTGTFCYTFNRNLRFGDGGGGATHLETDVRNLQTALEKEGFSVNDSEKKAGSVFGESTASAVVGFQQKYRSEILIPAGLANGNGFVGQLTRTKLNRLYGCSGPIFTPTPPYPDQDRPAQSPVVVSVGSKASGPDEIVAGELVYATGSGFLPSNIARIGSKDIIAPWTSATYLTFTAPDLAPGGYTFSILNDSGESASRRVSVSVNQPYLKLLSPGGAKILDAGRFIAVNWEWSGIDAVRFDLCTMSAGQKICKTTGPLAGVPSSSRTYSLWLDPNHPYFPSNTITVRADGLRNGVRVVRDESEQFEVRTSVDADSALNASNAGVVAGTSYSQMANTLTALQGLISQLSAAFGF